MGLQVLPPVHDVVGLGDTGDWRLLGLAFAADGRLYAEVFGKALNLWPVLVSYWPEALGAAAGVLVLAMLVPVLRVARRPQVVGAPHCRRCNYNLSGAAGGGGACPECGLAVGRGGGGRGRGPVVGRSRRRRAAAPVAVMLIALLGYGAPHAMRVGRENAASHLFDWTAPRVAAMVREHAGATGLAWLARHEKPDRALIEIDPATGVAARTVRRLGPFAAFGFSISPDGKTAATTMHRGELAAIDLASGRVLGRVQRLDAGRGPTTKYGGPAWRHVAGWEDAGAGGPRVLAQFFDPGAGTHTLYRWDVAAGTLEVVAAVPTPASVPPTGRYAWTATATAAPAPAAKPPAARLLYLMPGASPPLALEVPDSRAEDIQYDDDSTIRVRDLSNSGAVVEELTGEFWGGVAPVPLGDGRSFFIRGWGGDDVLLWSLGRGTGEEAAAGRVGGLKSPGFMGTLQDGAAGLAYHAPTGRLFVASTSPEGVYIRDTAAKAWTARLNVGFYALPQDDVAVSPDGRWVAIWAIEPTLVPPIGGPALPPGRPTFRSHVLIFDLTALGSPEGSRITGE